MIIGLVWFILALLALVSGSAFAGDYAIRWDWPTNTTTAAIEARYPWLQLGPERVNIELSFDAGSTWSRIASGVPSAYGTNTYAISLPDDSAWKSTNAVIRVATAPKYAQPQTISTVAIELSGIHLVAPPTTVTNGVGVALRWTSAGTGALVQLGYQAAGAQSWQPLAVFGSVDSSRAAITNTATWYVDGLPPGSGRILLQSMSDTNITRIASIEVTL